MQKPNQQPVPPPKTFFDKWFRRQRHAHNGYAIEVLEEDSSQRSAVASELFAAIRPHYIDPDFLKRIDQQFKSPSKVLQYWQGRLPITPKQRSGDLGEILASEYACRILKYEIPVKRLRWKDGRDSALRGDDLTALKQKGGRLVFLKAEVKSRISVSAATMNEVGAGLRRDAGLPGTFTLGFIAERLAELRSTTPAVQPLIDLILDAQVNGVPKASVSHLAFTVSGNPPLDAAKTYLDSHCMSAFKQVVACVSLNDHKDAIDQIYLGLSSEKPI